MNDTIKGAAAPIRKTTRNPFFNCNANGEKLFSVQEGISLDDALSNASCLLEAAEQTLFDVAMCGASSQVWAAAYLVEMAKAALDAVHIYAMKESNHE